MTEQITKEHIIHHIDTGPRVQFQLHFINKMLHEIFGEEKFEKLDNDEKHELVRELLENSEDGFNFGKKVADIIDNPENKKIEDDIEDSYTKNKKYEYGENQYEQLFKSGLIFELYNEALEFLKKSVMVHHY